MITRWQSYIGLLLALFAGCDANVQVNGTASDLEPCDLSTTCPTILVVDPVVANPGDTLTLRGVRFFEGMQVILGDGFIPVTLVSQTEATMVVPRGTTGLMELQTVYNNKTSKGGAFLRLDGENPLVTGGSDAVCVGQTYLDLDGALQAGTRVCGGAVDGLRPEVLLQGTSVAGVAGGIPYCSADGQESCYAIGDYRAVDIRGIEQQILVGSSFAGVTGTLAPPPGLLECTGDGQVGCITTEFFKAADIASFAPGDLRVGRSVGGVGGRLDLTNLAPQNIRAGLSINGVNGNLALPPAASVQAGVAYGSGAAEVTGNLVLPSAADVASGVSFGPPGSEVTGTRTVGSFTDCTGAGQTGCIATTTYRTQDLSGAGSANGLTSSNFASTIRTAADFEFWDAAGNRYSIAGDADLTAANLRNGTTIFGVTGNLSGGPANCGSAGEQDCVATGSYFAGEACGSNGQNNCFLDTGAVFAAADLTNLSAGNVKRGIVVAGTTGTFPSAASPLPRYADDGASTTEAGSDIDDLDTPNFLTRIKSNSQFEYWDSSGVRYDDAGDADIASGNVASGTDIFDVSGGVTAAPSNCSSQGEQSCVATGLYFAAQACGSNLEDDCFVDAGGAFDAGDFTNLQAANVRRGISIAGVTGNFPSTASPLPRFIDSGASTTEAGTDINDLTSATFFARMKSDSLFEYWDSSGIRYDDAGDSEITAANLQSGATVFGELGTLSGGVSQCTAGTQGPCETDPACFWTGSACEISEWVVKAGITIGGVAGSLKTNCRNTANSVGSDADGLVYNADSLPNNSGSAVVSTQVDWWDTIDNSNNDANNLPADVPTTTGWSTDNVCDTNVWEDVTGGDGCNLGPDDCMIRDRISGLTWSESTPTTGASSADSPSLWNNAVSRCNNLNYGSIADWRVPTQMELMQAYAHGIRDVGFKGGTIRPGGDNLLNNTEFILNVDELYWSATTVSGSTSQAWLVNLATGFTENRNKSDNQRVVCVTP